MSKPREIWWGYAKSMVRQYPTLANMQKTLSATKQKELNAVEQAITITRGKVNGHNRLEVINFVFWQKQGTLGMAAVKLYLSETTVRRYHQEFVRLVGECFGLTK